jgi:iron complex outermembrane receptor protein
LEYSEIKDRLSTNYKLAFLAEEYQYFADIKNDHFSFGKSESIIAKMDFGYQLIESIKLNGILDYNHTKGFGTSFGNNTRQIGAVALKAVQHVDDKWQNELGFRKEVSTDYNSPFLFSLGSTYVFNPFYTLKVNFSRNFRIPTFNDLYWEPGGNADLKPESSYQGEVGNIFSYKKFTLSETLYFIKINDLIRWVPNDGPNWSPENTDRVNTYGSETILGWTNSYGKNNFAVNGSYAYTISKNVDTNKQLFFVPYHKVTGSIAYSYGKLSVNYQYLFNGFVYTRSDNDPSEIIDGYQVSNVGIDYNFDFLEASKASSEIISLPMFPELTVEQIEYVANVIKEFDV